MADNENPEVTDDDVEGHMKHLAPSAKHMEPAANEDDDDVEGHVKHMGPSLSGAVNPDEGAPSSRHV